MAHQHDLQISAYTLEDIQKAHTKLLQQEEEINLQLDALLSRQCHLEAKLRGVTKAIPNLKVIQSDAKTLSEMITFTSNLAENVSAKVRKLDLARSRVSECQRRVLDVLDVQLCSEGVSAALRTEDYEKAAAHVHRYLSMDQSLLRQTAEDVAQGTSLWESLQVLQTACSQLREIIAIKFEEAVAAEDVASAERFFKVFPLLGMQDEGLKRFSIYLCSKLKETGEKNLRAVSSRSNVSGSDKRANVAFADTLTLLFEGIARLIEIHQPLVETYYGPGRMLSVVKHLQEECDRQSYQVFLEFTRQRNINQWLRNVREALKLASSASLSSSASTSSLLLMKKGGMDSMGDGGASQSGSSQQQSRPDPRELDILLGEMAIMHARSGLYVRFIRRRVINDLEVGIIEPAARAEKIKELETHVLGVSRGGGSGLCLAMQELLGNYSLLERYYLEESVAKAIAMDALVMDGGGTDEGTMGPPLTSMVDDTFFIIRKCIRRAASSGSLDGTCAILNMACSLLSGSGDTGLGGTLKKRLRSGYPTSLYLDLSQAYALASSAFHSSSLLLQSGVTSVGMSGGAGVLSGAGSSGSSSGSGIDSDRARLMFLAYFNDADIAVEYVETLRRTLLEELPPALSMASSNLLSGSTADSSNNPLRSPLDLLQGSEKAKLESCLVEGLSTVVAELRDLGKIGAHQLSSSAVKPRIAPWVDAFTTHNHTPSEEEFLTLEGEDSFVAGLLSHLSSLLSSFEGSLTPYNFDLLIGVVTSELAARMEKVILKSSFNRLGGLLLDREVRALTAFLTSKTTGSIRDKFSRLSQIATLLNLEKVSEVSDYWTVGEKGTPNTALSWQLNASEVKKVLGLRVDFRSEDVKRLKL